MENTGLQPVGGGKLTTPPIGEGPKHDVTLEPTEKPSTTLTNPISDIGKTRALIHTIPEIIESLKHVTPIAGDMFQQLFVTRGGDKGSNNDTLVLGRGPKSRLEGLAEKEGGRISSIDSDNAKEIFKKNFSDMRKADIIIQYMDNIPNSLNEAVKNGGQFSRAEKYMIDTRSDLKNKTIRKFE